VNGNCPKLLRNAWLTGCSALVLALAGCGGAETRDETPRIDPAAASELAAASEEVAQLIEEGNVCDAAHRADELYAAAQERVQDGRVPSELAGQLLENAEALRNEVNCEAEPPPDDEEEGEDGQGNGKGKGRDGKKKDGDD
jgi:hypothetical protein